MNKDNYQLHPLIADYARSHFLEGDKQANREAFRRAHEKAARYYQQQAADNCPPQKLRRRISDVHDLIEAIWHWCQAEQWQRAYALIVQESIFSSLQRWGGSLILLGFYEQLLPLDKWQPEPAQAARFYDELGAIYNKLGQKEEARKYFEQALRLFQEIGERGGEVQSLNHLGEVYSALSQKEQALACYERALSICEEIEDIEGKGLTLNNLGKIYHALGQKEQALRYYEQALPFHQDVSEEATTLNNLGGLYAELGHSAEAYRYYQKALRFFQEIGDRRGEGITLNNLAMYWKKRGKKAAAQEYYEQALRIFREIGDRWSEGHTLRNLGQLYLVQGHYKVALACIFLAKDILEEMQRTGSFEMRGIIALIGHQVGKQQFEALLAEVESEASSIVEQALRESF